MSAVHESTTTVEVLLSKAALNASLEPVSVGFKTERRWEKEKKGAFVCTRLSLEKQE